MGVVVQFKPKAIPAVLPPVKPSTFVQRGDGPSFDPGALRAFLDRARRKRNACLQTVGSCPRQDGAVPHIALRYEAEQVRPNPMLVPPGANIASWRVSRRFSWSPFRPS